MYHKVKSTLAGLAMVLAFVTGGLAFGEPVSPVRAPLAQPATSQPVEARVVLSALGAALAQTTRDSARVAADAEAIAQAARHKARATRLRIELGMPYYSFGAVLPRRGES